MARPYSAEAIQATDPSLAVVAHQLADMQRKLDSLQNKNLVGGVGFEGAGGVGAPSTGTPRGVTSDPAQPGFTPSRVDYARLDSRLKAVESERDELRVRVREKDNEMKQQSAYLAEVRQHASLAELESAKVVNNADKVLRRAGAAAGGTNSQFVQAQGGISPRGELRFRDHGFAPCHTTTEDTKRFTHKRINSQPLKIRQHWPR